MEILAKFFAHLEPVLFATSLFCSIGLILLFVSRAHCLSFLEMLIYVNVEEQLSKSLVENQRLESGFRRLSSEESLPQSRRLGQ